MHKVFLACFERQSSLEKPLEFTNYMYRLELKPIVYMYTLYTCTCGNDERQITGASREVPTGQSKQVEELQLANGSHNDPKQSTTEKEKCNEGIKFYVTLKILSVLSKKRVKTTFQLTIKIETTPYNVISTDTVSP